MIRTCNVIRESPLKKVSYNTWRPYNETGCRIMPGSLFRYTDGGFAARALPQSDPLENEIDVAEVIARIEGLFNFFL